MIELQIMISVITVFGSGISVYVGVRVALAEVKRDVSFLKEKDKEIVGRIDREGDESNRRIRRLEDVYFRTQE